MEPVIKTNVKKNNQICFKTGMKPRRKTTGHYRRLYALVCAHSLIDISPYLMEARTLNQVHISRSGGLAFVVNALVVKLFIMNYL